MKLKLFSTDSEENVRLIGFGRNIKLEEGETTANTDRAGTQENDYTKSSDIKVCQIYSRLS